MGLCLFVQNNRKSIKCYNQILVYTNQIYGFIVLDPLVTCALLEVLFWLHGEAGLSEMLDAHAFLKLFFMRWLSSVIKCIRGIAIQVHVSPKEKAGLMSEPLKMDFEKRRFLLTKSATSLKKIRVCKQIFIKTLEFTAILNPLPAE